MCADVVINLADDGNGWRIMAASYDGLPGNGVVDLRVEKYLPLGEQVDRLVQNLPDDLRI